MKDLHRTSAPLTTTAFFITLLFAALIGSLVTGNAANATDTAGNAPPLLRRGTNIAAWLTGTNRSIDGHDFLLIKNAGFDFVRLPVDPKLLHYDLNSDTPADQQLSFTQVDKAIALASNGGLAVVLDIHPDDQFKLAIEKSGTAADHFVEFWTALAKHYRALDVQKLAYQFLNEPQYYKKEAEWAALTRRLVAAVRRVDGKHLLIISAPQGSSIDGLLDVEPIDDPHIAYDFHFYEPYIVTHQGAWWFGDSPIRYLQHVRYPSDRANETDIAVSSGGNLELARGEFQKYIAENWNNAHIESRIDAAADWARQHKVRLLNLEFGVLITRTDPDSRYRWLSDVRQAFDRNGIGWAVFDYTDSFAIIKPNGVTTTDPNNGSTRWDYPSNETRAIDPDIIKTLDLHPTTGPTRSPHG